MRSTIVKVVAIYQLNLCEIYLLVSAFEFYQLVLGNDNSGSILGGVVNAPHVLGDKVLW